MTGGLATLEDIDATAVVDEPVLAVNPLRRFTIAVTVGMALVSVPYLWVLWDLWTGRPSLLRWVGTGGFYDEQARAMLAGHLYVPKGSLGIEAFIHNGHQYTYFGLFPSLIRMPLLFLTTQYDAKLTAGTMLLSWLMTGVVGSMLVWRVRILMRGSAALGRAEAVSYGVLIASITGGSVLVYLAATPFVYNEDFAWSVALTAASIFALLGVLERPSWGRVTAAGFFILCANLDRTPTGYACSIGALLVAAWFFLGRDGRDNRRWVIPMVLAGLVPLAVSCVVTWIKFGLPFGLPMADQVWAHVNAHRRYFLAANGGKAFSPRFIPSTAFAYFQPFGLHVSAVFPFITLPTAPAAAYGGVVLDQTYQTGSIPATMPLLFILSCWGVVTTFRRRQVGRVRLIRIPMFAAAIAVTGVLVWGYIADRYMADFLPLLMVAGAVGLVDVWRRARGWSIPARRLTLAAVVVLGVFGVVANVAIAITPVGQWTTAQVVRFVGVQHSISPGALAATVDRGRTVPYWAPTDQLFVAGDCSAMYLSTGITYKDTPGQQIQHFTWLPVETGPGIVHNVSLKFNVPVRRIHQKIPLLSYGAATLVLEPTGTGQVRLAVENAGAANVTWPATTSNPLIVVRRKPYRITVTTDPYLKSIGVKMWEGGWLMDHYLAGTGPAVVHTTSVQPGQPVPPVTVSNMPDPVNMALCRAITR